MPYIVTTRRGNVHHSDPALGVSRRAVATLEEARHAAAQIAREHSGDTGDPRLPVLKALAISPLGGTIGPLPDGTVIDVASVTEFDLKVKALVSPRATVQEACDAFNARQEATR